MDDSRRIIYVDSLKGFAILLVILGHIIQMWYESDNGYVYNKLWLYIYSFHMPLFIFISGYISGISTKPVKMNEFLRKRFMQLLVPFFIWTFIYYIKLDEFRLIWFLWALFFISVISLADIKISKKLSINKYGIYIVSIIVTAIISYIADGKYGIEKISQYLYIYILGTITGTHRQFIFKSKSSIWLALGLPIWIILAYYWVWPDNVTTNNIVVHICQPIYKAVLWLTAVYSIFYLFIRYERIIAKTGLHIIGRKTLGIYVLHYIFIDQLCWRFFNIVPQNYLFVFIYLIIITLFFYLITVILEKNAITRLIFLGQRRTEKMDNR